MCESNYNLVELGPRGTGKSYAYQELSPYAILLTRSNYGSKSFLQYEYGEMGLVGLWDAIGFDEVADLQKMPKELSLCSKLIASLEHLHEEKKLFRIRLNCNVRKYKSAC